MQLTKANLQWMKSIPIDVGLKWLGDSMKYAAKFGFHANNPVVDIDGHPRKEYIEELLQEKKYLGKFLDE